jgi:hypothetical protein
MWNQYIRASMESFLAGFRPVKSNKAHEDSQLEAKITTKNILYSINK